MPILSLSEDGVQGFANAGGASPLDANAKHCRTGTTPFVSVYGSNLIPPIESSLAVTKTRWELIMYVSEEALHPRLSGE